MEPERLTSSGQGSHLWQGRCEDSLRQPIGELETELSQEKPHMCPVGMAGVYTIASLSHSLKKDLSSQTEEDP